MSSEVWSLNTNSQTVNRASACCDWANTWGLGLAYAVTQSVEASESIIKEAVAACLISEKNSDLILRFAKIVWELSESQSFHSFSTDRFFKLQPIERAITVLKLSARLSLTQISSVFSCSIIEVQNHLDRARFAYSSGKPWIQTNTKKVDPQSLFLQYIGNDLHQDESKKLHSHFLKCNECFTNYVYFKKQYLDWQSSLPQVQSEKIFQNEIKKIAKITVKMSQNKSPNLWPSLVKLMMMRNMQILFACLLCAIVVYRILEL